MSRSTSNSQPKKRLLLWDIDGTLITSGGGGDSALERAIQERFGTDDALRDIEIAGRTDRHIAMSILRKYGVEPTPEAVSSFLDVYLRWLGELLPNLNGRVLPGVQQILDRLHGNPERVLALLTGNLRRGAELKLSRYGLWHYFDFGAFADDHHDRNELGAFARRRAQEDHGHEFEAAAIDVIGDTGHDIACGKIFGARTIAVATGTWTREQLAQHEPDFLFDDLSDSEQVIATLGW
jgi:phosphoglycolate phosphatase-like HAD superfamily hydrolase